MSKIELPKLKYNVSTGATNISNSNYPSTNRAHFNKSTTVRKKFHEAEIHNSPPQRKKESQNSSFNKKTNRTSPAKSIHQREKELLTNKYYLISNNY